MSSVDNRKLFGGLQEIVLRKRIAEPLSRNTW